MQIRSETGNILFDDPEVNIIEENDDHVVLNTGFIVEDVIIVEDDNGVEVVVVNGESFEFVNPHEGEGELDDGDE